MMQSLVRVRAAPPITNRDALDLTDREGIVERTEVENNSREAEGERGERKGEREGERERKRTLRGVLYDAYSRGVRGTSSPMHLCRLMHRGSTFAKYPDKLAAGRGRNGSFRSMNIRIGDVAGFV